LDKQKKNKKDISFKKLWQNSK